MADLQAVRTVPQLSGQLAGLGFSPELSTGKSTSGHLLMTMRITRGLSQAEVAVGAGVDVRSIRRAERGEASPTTVARIERALLREDVGGMDSTQAAFVLTASAVALAPLLGAKSEWAIGPERRSSRPASRLRRHMARLANAHFGISLEKIAAVYGCRRQSVAEQVQAAEAEIAADDDLGARVADLYGLIEATVRRTA